MEFGSAAMQRFSFFVPFSTLSMPSATACVHPQWVPDVTIASLYYNHSSIYRQGMSLGNLQSDVLGSLQKLGKASVRQVMEGIGGERRIAYTTVSTVLDRLYRKGLVKRTKTTGRGGVRYVYSYAATPDVRTSLVRRSLNQLVSAFGPSIVPTIYESLDHISKEETGELKRKN